MNVPGDSANQQVLFERVHSAYTAHCYGPSSLAYRREFILKSLRTDAPSDLNGCRVADIASGSGINSLILRDWFPGVRCSGFDISRSACEDYRRLTGGNAYEVDLTRPLDIRAVDGPYDAALVVGGLHHTVVDLPAALRNTAALVRPGGFLFMMEPNSRYLLEGLRRLWYRLDSNFDATTEHALDPAELAELGAPWFRPLAVSYCGGPAYFLIQQSISTRVPLRVKPRLASLLLPLERLYARLPSPRVHAFFTAIWERGGTS